MTNLEIVKKELERVAVDGHEFEAGKKIVKKLVFDNAGELSDCVMAIAKAKGIAKNSFMIGFLVGINWGVKDRVIELITKEESFKY